MNKIQAGANLAIAQATSIDVSVSWLPDNSALDVCAFVLDDAEKVRGPDDFIYFNHLKSQNGFIAAAATSGRTQFHIDLGKTQPGVVKIVFAVATPADLTKLFDLNIDVSNQVSFSPALEAMQSLILGELYLRNGQWKFRAIGQGFKNGLEFLAERYAASLNSQASGMQLDEPKIELAPVIRDQTPPPAPRPHRTALERNFQLVKDLSWIWVIYSVLIIIASELVLAGVFGQLLVGPFIPHNLRFLLESVAILFSFFVGGAVIGIISSEIRILEPAIAAFVCVFMTFLVGLFSPVTFIQFSLLKVIFGGSLAFVLAMAGAHLGEKISARFGVQASKDFFDAE